MYCKIGEGHDRDGSNKLFESCKCLCSSMIPSKNIGL